MGTGGELLRDAAVSPISTSVSFFLQVIRLTQRISSNIHLLQGLSLLSFAETDKQSTKTTLRKLKISAYTIRAMTTKTPTTAPATAGAGDALDDEDSPSGVGGPLPAGAK